MLIFDEPIDHAGEIAAGLVMRIAPDLILSFSE
jgi:hypothetical protein